MLPPKTYTSFRLWLQKEFTDRCRRNGRYSLRAFAKLLQMEPSSVSQILSGKRIASQKVVSQICARLSVAPEQAQAFQQEILKRKKRIDTAELASHDYFQVNADIFAVIADWYHYAILELTFVREFKSNPKWIATKLGISATEATLAIERLKRLGLIEEKNKKLVKTTAHLTNGPDGFTAPALRELQRQLLQKAIDAIDECAPEEKDITSMTMAIDPLKLPEARAKIRNFRRELCGFLETSGHQTRVYNLGVQLFPLSKLSH